MNLQNVERKAQALGLTTEHAQLTSGAAGLFVNYEALDAYGTARAVAPSVTGQLEKYLRRYKMPFEYRGNYTTILVKEAHQ